MKKRLFVIIFVFAFITCGCSNRNNASVDNTIEQDNNNEVDQTIILENKKKMITCLENELGGYIASEKNELSDLPLKDITDREDRIQ